MNEYKVFGLGNMEIDLTQTKMWKTAKRSSEEKITISSDILSFVLNYEEQCTKWE